MTMHVTMSTLLQETKVHCFVDRLQIPQLSLKGAYLVDVAVPQAVSTSAILDLPTPCCKAGFPATL